MPLLQNPKRLFSRSFRIHGSSMEPTYRSDTSIRINPLSYVWGVPRRGDVVSLRRFDTPERTELKRVVGLPGEEVSWDGSEIWINGSKLEESYVRKTVTTPGDELQTRYLKSDEYFVAGDNRLYSEDSRAYGPVKLLDILGKVI